MLEKLKSQDVRMLVYLVKSYDTIVDAIKVTKQRAQSLHVEWAEDHDPILGGEDGFKGLNAVKGIIARRIEKEMAVWPLWTDYLQQVPGIGPAIGGKLLCLYYIRNVAICPECETDVEKTEGTFWCPKCECSIKGAGNLKFRIEERDFSNVSKWHAYMGMHVVDGVKPKRKKGVVSNWTTEGRTLCYLIGDQFNRQTNKTPYGSFLLERKAKHEVKHPEWSKGHRLNAARHEAARLFLAHMWHVARTLDGKETNLPYVHQIMGHTNLIKPFHWDGE